VVVTVEASHDSIGRASTRTFRLPRYPSGKHGEMCLVRSDRTKENCLILFSYRILHATSSMVGSDSLRAMTPSAQFRLKNSEIAVSNRPQSASSTSEIRMLKAKALEVISSAGTGGTILILDEAFKLMQQLLIQDRWC